MERITKTCEVAASAEVLERLWRSLERNAILRGSIDGRFEALPGGRTRVSVSTAYEADGERRIDDALARLQNALDDNLSEKET